MKKSLLALAVLGAFAGAASAQSSVTIYGVLDLGVMKSNGGTAPNPASTGFNGASKAWQLSQSSENRLGFRGNEDLGGGLSAQFQIEHRYFLDTGAVRNANSFWQGRSYVQLSSATAGRVYLGRDYSPVFWPAVKSDPFGWDGVGQMGSAMWAGYLNSDATANSVRTSNTVGYKSPNMGGLTFQGAVALSEGPTVGRNNGLNAEYSAGPIYAAFGYEKISKGTLKDGNGLVNLALHYDFGMAKVMGYYAKAKIGPNGSVGSKFFSIGVLAPVGPGNVKAAWYRLDPDGDNNNASKLGLGYDYALSKRTNLYADIGLGRADTKTNNTAWGVGIKHTF